MQTGGHQTGDVGHVYKQIGAHFLSNFREDFKVDDAGVGRSAGDDHLGLMLSGQLAHLVIVDVAVPVYTVCHHVVVLTGEVGGRAMSQMTAVVQAHAHNGVAGSTQSLVNCEVGLSTGVRLNIGKVCTEELLGALNSDVLYHIYALAAAVVAASGITLGVFVGEYGSSGGKDSVADDVFGGDQLNVLLLTLKFGLDGAAHFGIHRGEELHCILNHEKTPSGVKNRDDLKK